MTDFLTARAKIGGLKGVMRALNDAPENDQKWKSMTKCPFCRNRDSAGVFAREGVDYFKCFHNTCSSAGTVMSEVGYIAARLGLSEDKPVEGGASPAYRKFLELAGCWEEAPAKPEKSVGEIHSGNVNPPEGVSATGLRTTHESTPSNDKGGAAPSEFTSAAPLPSSSGTTSAATLDLGLGVLREFYVKLEPTHTQLVPDGNEFRVVTLLEKRGLLKTTCERLGFRANPRSNEKILHELSNQFGWNELVASGLWLEADRKRKLDSRPNTQFCGKGNVGRKPEAERRHRDDKVIWGWCQPVLIPYFNEMGELMKLRPHKGGAKGGTVAGRELIYVPRDFQKCADLVEKFNTVVICEAEYKADVIWQEIGLGSIDLDGEEAVGVCALPGISFARNKPMREDLETWLKAVGARRVIVAFDDEDHSDRPLAKRLDAVKYARYLAIDLSKKIHVTGMWMKLPLDWRIKGKADWDGALQMIAKGIL
jgi:hypothetical protein